MGINDIQPRNLIYIRKTLTKSDHASSASLRSSSAPLNPDAAYISAAACCKATV